LLSACLAHNVPDIVPAVNRAGTGCRSNVVGFTVKPAESAWNGHQRTHASARLSGEFCAKTEICGKVFFVILKTGEKLAA
jgi:hypothetical protein